VQEGAPRLLDPQLLNPIAQRPEADPQYLGSGRLVVARLLQRFDDCVALHLLELRTKRALDGRSVWRLLVLLVRGAKLYIVALDHIPRAKRQGPLQDVLELTHITGEAVLHQGDLGLAAQSRG